MNGRASVEISSVIEGVGINVKVPTDQKQLIREIVQKSMKSEKDTLLDMSLNVRCVILGAYGSEISIKFIENPLLRIETISNRRSTNQNKTLRGIERFLFIIENGYEPIKDDMYWIHEGLLEKYSSWVANPLSGVNLPKRTSDPSMTTTEMAKIVEGALNDMASSQIPDSILTTIGHDMKLLWENWYRWRYEQDKDPLLEAENEMSWEKYKEIHPVCEFCSLPGVDLDPLERMHIITAGSDKSIYEMPWNWFAAHRSHHNLQHNEGWNIIERSYPHVKGKINRARLMQGETNENKN
jgi:hypothetical protein